MLISLVVLAVQPVPRCAVPRRTLLVVAAAPALSLPCAALASLGYTDAAGAKSYSGVQRAWENQAGMTDVEVRMSLRGAAPPPAAGEAEPEPRRKRRAMAACKEPEYRKVAGVDSEASCNARVMAGDVQFILDALAGST